MPDVPAFLINGREELYLRWFFEHFSYDPSALSRADLDEYVQAMTGVGALRAGLGYYRSVFDTAAQNEIHRRTMLEMPISAWGGAASLGPLPKTCLEMAGTKVTGGVIYRCGHWVGEERPDFLSAHLLEFFGNG